MKFIPPLRSSSFAAARTRTTMAEYGSLRELVAFYMQDDFIFFNSWIVRQVLIFGDNGQSWRIHLLRLIRVVIFPPWWQEGVIVVRILHYVHQLHDVCIFLPMRYFGEKAAWVDQAHDTVQLNLFYMMIGLTHHEKQTSCTWCTWCKILTTIPPVKCL